MAGALSKAAAMYEGGPKSMEFAARGPLSGIARLPGDKSISHRALMLAAMARGRSRIDGLSEGTDVACTAAALRAMGARIEREGGACEVEGVGTGCLLQPECTLDMGNSGTSARLLMGLVASHPVIVAFTGDPSLCRRPMDRVVEPLRRVGADFTTAPGNRLPLILRGSGAAVPHAHRLNVASAQVKSALLFAALNIAGVTRVIEPVRTRDHSERLLKRFGADIRVAPHEAGRQVAISGEAELRPQHLRIPGDASGAAFLAVAALIVPGSELRLEGVGINPIRTGLFELLRMMGGDIRVEEERELDGEPVADLVVRHSALRGIEVPTAIIPSMIDEFPIFFVAAVFAEGISRAAGLGELRIKESDRIGAMACGLRAIGAAVQEQADGLVIEGSGGGPLAGGAKIDPQLDHRVAMSFAVAGLHCRHPVTIGDMRPVETSFPNFAELLEGLAS